MKYNKNIQNKVFQEKIFPPILKNIKIEIKGKGKDKESYIFIVYTIFNIN